MSPGRSSGLSGLKDACKAVTARRTKENNYLEYLDKMQETLNKNIQDNVFPNWRQHPSLKGKSQELSNGSFQFDTYRMVEHELPDHFVEPPSQSP